MIDSGSIRENGFVLARGDGLALGDEDWSRDDTDEEGGFGKEDTMCQAFGGLGATRGIFLAQQREVEIRRGCM